MNRLVALSLLLTTTLFAGDVPFGHANWKPSPTDPVGFAGQGGSWYPGAIRPTIWQEGTRYDADTGQAVWQDKLRSWRRRRWGDDRKTLGVAREAVLGWGEAVPVAEMVDEVHGGTVAAPLRDARYGPVGLSEELARSPEAEAQKFLVRTAPQSIAERAFQRSLGNADGPRDRPHGDRLQSVRLDKAQRAGRTGLAAGLGVAGTAHDDRSRLDDLDVAEFDGAGVFDQSVQVRGRGVAYGFGADVHAGERRPGGLRNERFVFATDHRNVTRNG